MVYQIRVGICTSTRSDTHSTRCLKHKALRTITNRRSAKSRAYKNAHNAEPRLLGVRIYRRSAEVYWIHLREISTYLGGAALGIFLSSPALTRKNVRKPHPTSIRRDTRLNYNVCCRSLALSRLALSVTSTTTNIRSTNGSI